MYLLFCFGILPQSARRFCNCVFAIGLISSQSCVNKTLRPLRNPFASFAVKFYRKVREDFCAVCLQWA